MIARCVRRAALIVAVPWLVPRRLAFAQAGSPAAHNLRRDAARRRARRARAAAAVGGETELPGRAERAARRRARAVIRVIGDPAIGVSDPPALARSAPSPLTPELIQPVEQLPTQPCPGIPVIPTTSTGATDGRFPHGRGIPTYGVTGLFVDMDDHRAHGPDERMNVKAYFDGQAFLYRLVTMLASGNKLAA